MLRGAVDSHVHSAPDLRERALTDIELAREAVAAGMRGIVLKNHAVPTVSRAILANEVVGEPILHGGVVLNGGVGGLNPVAVENALELGGSVVWLPTSWSTNHASRARSQGRDYVSGQRVPTADEELTLLEDGELVEPVCQIVALVGAYDRVLATGHVSPEEALAVARECERRGTNCLVNHPFSRYFTSDVAVHEHLADHGAVLEYCALSFTDHGATVPDLLDAIHRIGPEHCVLASDYGQARNPPIERFERFLTELETSGLPTETLRDLLVRNPAALFGLGE